MTALAADRMTPQRAGVDYVYPVAAATTIYTGSLVVLDAAGNAKPGTTATGLVAAGRAEHQVANPGLAGAEQVRVRRGVYRWVNSAAGDLIGAAEVNRACYIVDDQTVAKTSAGGTRSPAGLVVAVDEAGVWVDMSYQAVVAAAGALLPANNLSDVASAATARANLGATATGAALFTAANAGAGRTALGLGTLAVQNAPAAGAAAGTGVAVAESAGVVQRTTFTLTGVQVATTDVAGTCGYGGLKIYDFPAGLIQVLGAVTDLTLAAAAGIGATAALVGSLGTATAAGDNATLTGTEADIVPSTACPLVAGAGTMKGRSTAGTMAAGVFDGTSAAKALYLNFALPDADSSGNSTVTATGTIIVTWINHGDN